MTEPFLRFPDDPCGLARQMFAAMRHAVLAVKDPATLHPHLSKIACQTDPDGVPVALLSGPAVHSQALAADLRSGLLIETRRDRGDPMVWARLSLQVTAEVIENATGPRDRWLRLQPKAAAFVDLADFRFWRLRPLSGFLNAGFGAAFRLTPQDLGME